MVIAKLADSSSLYLGLPLGRMAVGSLYSRHSEGKNKDLGKERWEANLERNLS